MSSAGKFELSPISSSVQPVRSLIRNSAHPVAESNENAKKAGVTNRARFEEEDLFEVNISDATVVILFLWPSVNMKLRPKLLKEL